MHFSLHFTFTREDENVLTRTNLVFKIPDLFLQNKRFHLIVCLYGKYKQKHSFVLVFFSTNKHELN